jgi:putative transposase
VKGPWPTPAVDAAEALAAKYASDWPAWGHRKIAAMMRADDHTVSTSTVERALRRRGLLLPRGFRADRKSWAALRRKVFRDPPTERNRVWQTDFSEFETTGGGIWRICAVIDYATKYCLAATIAPTGRGVDALACLHAAVAEAERVLGLDDLRDDRGELELVDENTGEVIDIAPAPIAVVSDNGSCFRGETYQAAFAGEDPLLRHVRAPVSGHPDQRRHRTILRHAEVRAPLPRPDRRRRRDGDGDRPLPRHLQPHPPTLGPR